jgi:hypothetical protein
VRCGRSWCPPLETRARPAPPAAPQVLRYGLARSVYLSRAIHSPTVVPNLYAGIVAGGEEAVCTDLGLNVGRARDKLGCRDMVGGIQEIAAITVHGAPAVRAASPRQAARFHASTRGCALTTRLYLGEVEPIR